MLLRRRTLRYGLPAVKLRLTGIVFFVTGTAISTNKRKVLKYNRPRGRAAVSKLGAGGTTLRDPRSLKHSAQRRTTIQTLVARIQPLRSEGTLPALVGGLAVLTIVLAFDALLGFNSSAKWLYVLPIWVATRQGGRHTGLLVVLATAALLAIVEAQTRHIASGDLVRDSVLRLCALSIVMLIVAQAEESVKDHRQLAMKDPLTGLFNRRALTDFAQAALRRARCVEEPLTAVVIDCDGFKSLNDTYGHHAGDHVLRILARLLESETRASDLVARLGGDEFVAIFPNSDTEEVRHIMHRIEQLFEQAVMDAGYECTISFGFAPLEEEANTIDNLIAKADKAMYRRKEHRKGIAYLN